MLLPLKLYGNTIPLACRQVVIVILTSLTFFFLQTLNTVSGLEKQNFSLPCLFGPLVKDYYQNTVKVADLPKNTTYTHLKQYLPTQK